MLISHKKPMSKHLTLHPRNKYGSQEKISYKTSHTILGINFDKKTNFVKHIKSISGTISRDVRSMRILKKTSFDSKTYLYKTILQPKIIYSYPIHHLLSRNQQLKIQACQNIAIYRFVLDNIPYDERLYSEHRHVKMRLKSIAQLAWERGKSFYKRLKRGLPDLHDMFVEYANMPIVTTRNSRVRRSPMQFALAPRPAFFYSEDHYTKNWDHYPG